MRQVAVAPHAQSRGISRALISFAEEFALKQGYTTITLNLGETAIPSYDRLRYERMKEQFEAHTISHLNMQKRL